MKSMIVVCALVAAVITAIPAGAEQFTFTVKNLSLSESRSLPGGRGDYGSVMNRTTNPVKVPQARSSHPLYGILHRNNDRGRPLVFMDESNGTGKGYDRLIVDLNDNGDFTDDPVINGTPKSVNSPNDEYEQCDFGPIELPSNKAKGIWRPRFFANVYLYNKRVLKNAQSGGEPLHVGQLRVFAANILETTVDINGVKQRFGLVDGNCNFAIGDPVTVTKIMRRPNDPGEWYMIPGDNFLRDIDQSGKFERTQTNTESQIYSKYIYFGGKPYITKLSEDLKTISFEAFTGPCGDLQVKGNVTELVLGLEGSPWEAVTPGIQGGKAVLPAGNYHISSCVISTKIADGQIRAETSDVPDKMFSVAADKSTDLDAGCPLVISVLTEKQLNTSGGSSIMSAARSLFGGSSTGKSYDLRMNVEVSGTGGEKYSGFMRSSGEYIPPPKFQIVDTQSKELASGSFEYG